MSRRKRPVFLFIVSSLKSWNEYAGLPSSGVINQAQEFAFSLEYCRRKSPSNFSLSKKLFERVSSFSDAAAVSSTVSTVSSVSIALSVSLKVSAAKTLADKKMNASTTKNFLYMIV